MGPSGDGLSTPKGRSFPVALPLVLLKKLPDNFGQCALGADSSSKLPVASAEWVVMSAAVSHDPFPVGREVLQRFDAFHEPLHHRCQLRCGVLCYCSDLLRLRATIIATARLPER